MMGIGTREPSAELGRYSKAAYANLARMGKYRKCQNEKEVIQKMKRILIAILIALMIFAQGVSADGGTIIIGCPEISIDAVSITDDETLDAGNQVYPQKPPCLDVVRCNATPNDQCCDNCGCFYIANGSFVGVNGTHCATGFGPGYQPVGVVACNYTPPPDCTGSPWNNECDFDSNGSWVGDNKGGYAYDVDDGYKMGLRMVEVNVTITTTGEIKCLCKNSPAADGKTGSVSMTVDNYDSQKGTRIVYAFDDAPECSSNPTGQTGTWTGYFYMHYWEKPGLYTVTIDADCCCGSEDTYYPVFDYQSKGGVCIAPPGRDIDFGTATACGPNAEAIANGDNITSTCEQCDLCSEPPTLRNIGNTMINLGIWAKDMTSSTTSFTLSVSRVIGGYYSSPSPTQGVLWVNVDSEWNDLTDDTGYETVTLPAQKYCNFSWIDDCESGCENVTTHCEGLPPGPHATNNFSLRIWPVPCVSGEFRNDIYVAAKTAYSYYEHVGCCCDELRCACCQDHREPYFPLKAIDSGACIDPPQCYEEDRYTDLGMTRSEFNSICAP